MGWKTNFYSDYCIAEKLARDIHVHFRALTSELFACATRSMTSGIAVTMMDLASVYGRMLGLCLAARSVGYIITFAVTTMI